MTPKEKAQEIVNKYILYTEKYVDGWIESDLHSAKFCALIAVDEMIDWSKQWVDEEMLTPALIYLENVKKEIEKL